MLCLFSYTKPSQSDKNVWRSISQNAQKINSSGDIINPQLPWCHFHLKTFCLCDCHLVCWNQSNKWTLPCSQSLLQSHCSAPKNRKKNVHLFKCLNTNCWIAFRMQNTSNIPNALFYCLHISEALPSLFHTLLVNRIRQRL